MPLLSSVHAVERIKKEKDSLVVGAGTAEELSMSWRLLSWWGSSKHTWTGSGPEGAAADLLSLHVVELLDKVSHTKEGQKCLRTCGVSSHTVK